MFYTINEGIFSKATWLTTKLTWTRKKQICCLNFAPPITIVAAVVVMIRQMTRLIATMNQNFIAIKDVPQENLPLVKRKSELRKSKLDGPLTRVALNVSAILLGFILFMRKHFSLFFFYCSVI